MNEAQIENLKTKLQRALQSNGGKLRIKGTGIDKELMSFIRSSKLGSGKGSSLLGIKAHQWTTWQSKIKANARIASRLDFKEIPIVANPASQNNFHLSIEVSSVEDAAKLIRSLC